MNDAFGLPVNYQQSTNRAELYFYAAMVLLLLTVFISVRLRDSRLGRAWIAIREDETAAAAMGVPLMQTKTWAYAIGAFFGGVAGAYYATFKSGAFPSDFYFNFSVFILCMVILGGMGSVWGAIVGGMLLATSTRRAGEDRHGRRHQRRAEVQLRHLRCDHRADDALPADGADRRATSQGGAGRGVHDTPLYDVSTEGADTYRGPE